METPLMVAVEEARLKLYSAFNNVAEETKLPPFLLEGVVTDLLSEIRKQKYVDLLAMIEQKEGEKLE